MEKYLPKVSIVILNYNGRDVLKRCLASVFAIDYSKMEIILVDNNSQDGSLEMAKASFSKAIFIKNEENLGFSAGNNVGIRFALERGAELVLLLNYDTEVERDFLTKLINIAQKDEKTGIFSPLILEGETKKPWFSGGKIDWLRMKAIQEKNSKKINAKSYQTEFISGCAMLVKKEVFKKIGLLDEDFFLYWEDVDFSYRAKKAGFGRKVVPDSIVCHFEKSEKSKANKVYWLVLSGLIFFRKNTSFSLKFWIAGYVFLRKIKNRIDIRMKNKIELAYSVKKAYEDFERGKF